jgi:hypothetical protein
VHLLAQVLGIFANMTQILEAQHATRILRYASCNNHIPVVTNSFVIEGLATPVLWQDLRKQLLLFRSNHGFE